MFVPRGAFVRLLICVAATEACVACVPGYEVTSGGELVAFTGRVVAGQAEFEGQTVDCDWLIGVDGRRLTIIYPPGWDQRYRPFRLLDGSGQVVAQEGDMLRITYMSGGSGESICPGEVQAAETVERVSPVTSPRQSAS